MTLFESLFSAVPEGWLNLWSRTEKGPCGSEWFNLAEPEALSRAAALALTWDTSGADVYFSVCPARERRSGLKRINKGTVLCVPAYFVDVDTLEDVSKADHGKKRLPTDRADAVRRLNALPVPPSLCVDSGHGIHAYWLLSEAIFLNGDDYKDADGRLNRFAKSVAEATGCLDLDAHASEVARVLRVPGTHNHKRDASLPVELLPSEGGPRRCSSAELDEWAESVEAEATPRTAKDQREKPRASTERRAAPSGAGPMSEDYAPGGRYYLTDARIWDFIRRKPEGLRLLNGDISDYASHSEADLAICNELAFYTGGDRVRMDELYRNTLLFREKWDERHDSNGRTYGEITLETACRDTTNYYVGRDYVWKRLSDERQAAIRTVAEAYNRASGGAFQIRGTATCAVGERNGEERVEPLADFIAVPVETITKDDGAEIATEYVLDGFDYRGNALPRVQIKAAQLRNFAWLADKWPGAVIEAGTQKADKLRAAVQKAERELAERRNVYTHTGWRRIDGCWVFLHQNGAVGAQGVSVELPGKLAGYALPEAPLSVQDCARASLDLLDFAPYRITAPLLATMYLAPLYEWCRRGGEAPASMLVVKGKTQSRKSVTTALFLSHFGAGFTYQTLPLNFQSTGNAVCHQLFGLKDVPAVIDDFHPTASERRGGTLDEMTRIARRISRAVGDDATRMRLASDGQTAQQDRPARGLAIITAEFMPDLGESGESRAYVIPMEPGDIPDGKRLDAAQDMARRGVYASAMHGYIEWLGGQLNARGGVEIIVKRLQSELQQTRHTMMELDPEFSRHGRLGTAGAWLLIGLRWALDYFHTAGAAESAELDIVYHRGRDAILENLKAHAGSVVQTDPLILFAQSMDEISGTIGTFTAPGEGLELEHGKDWCGWKTPEALYIKPQRTFARITELSKAAGTPFPISAKELWERLYKAGISGTPKGVTMRIPRLPGVQHALQLDCTKLAQLREGHVPAHPMAAKQLTM